jgi:hypothetical protein
MTLSEISEQLLIVEDCPIKHLVSLQLSPITAPERITQSVISQLSPIITPLDIDEPEI